MTVDAVYNLYNSTFATIKNDDDSFYAFRKMLHEFGIIDDKIYLDLAIDDSDRIQNESKMYDYYYIVNESEIPSFEEFYSDDFKFHSDIIRILFEINHVIIVDEEGSEVKYNKVINDCGVPEWEKIYGDSDVITISTSDLITIIEKYIISLQYNYKINDDYLNINVSKFKNDDLEISDLYSIISGWYKKILNVEGIDSDDWKRFLSFVEDSGIIDSITKSRLLSNSSAATF